MRSLLSLASFGGVDVVTITLVGDMPFGSNSGDISLAFALEAFADCCSTAFSLQ